VTAGLSVEQLEVRFGGLRAVDGVSLSAPQARITGLIGPNGAGKTTIFNACTGVVPANAGRIVLFGADITGMPPSARAQRGLGRTFQRMELFDSLTVRENVALGREAALAGRRALGLVFARPGERAEVAAAVREALSVCGLEEIAGRPVAALSTGERRLVELARALAAPFRILLLDEPSSGLDQAETSRMSSVLRRVVEQRGQGILLVEHDMGMVMDICHHLYVLDFGRLIFEGTPADVAASDVVRAAYLGSEALI
jgi:ABC-type branched-subunit amino acid transport system ATPase component